jgi:hypothetical protein
MKRRWLTVIAEPHKKVLKADIEFVLSSSSAPRNNLNTSGPSPTKITRGAKTIALNKFVYHDKSKALLLTTSRLRLITTECEAVIAELVTPKNIPVGETGVPSRKTPMKKPRVTMAQENKMRRDGRVWRTMKDVPTVNGRTRPLATW